MKEIGICVYCKDPIYDSQFQEVIEGNKHHKGCFAIMKAEKLVKEAGGTISYKGENDVSENSDGR